MEAGAPLVHLVDLDGAAAGRPVNTDAIQAVARAVATPLQLAGGIDGPDQIELAFAAGATRVVIPSWIVADAADRLAACVRVGGDWLAVGLDARPERLAAYPWRRAVAPTLAEFVAELAAAGVHRFIVSHGGAQPDLERLGALCRTVDGEILVAGGITELATVSRMRDVGVAAVILGEVLFTGTIDLTAAVAAAA